MSKPALHWTEQSIKAPVRTGPAWAADRINHNGHPPRSGQVARALALQASTVTRLADRLVASGHLTRGRDPRHRGVVTLALTRDGQDLVRPGARTAPQRAVADPGHPGARRRQGGHPGAAPAGRRRRRRIGPRNTPPGTAMTPASAPPQRPDSRTGSHARRSLQSAHSGRGWHRYRDLVRAAEAEAGPYVGCARLQTRPGFASGVLSRGWRRDPVLG